MGEPGSVCGIGLRFDSMFAVAREMRRIFKIVFWSFAAFLAVVVASAAIIHYFYSEEVKQYVISSISSSLAVKMNIESAEFSMWTNFPKASVDLKNVWMEDALSPGETLLEAERVSLAFNLFSLLGGNYRLSSVSVESGALTIRYDENGKDNYHFWKQTGEEENSGSISLDLIYLESMALRYDDRKQATLIECRISELELDGTIRSPESSFDVEGLVLMDFLELGGEKYLRGQRIGLNGELAGSNDFSKLEFRDFQTSLAEGNVLANGTWSSGATNISLESKSAGPELLSAIIPGFWDEIETNYHIEALFDFKGNYIVQKGSSELTGRMSIVDGSVEHRASGELLRNIRGGSELSIRNRVAFSIEELNASFRNGRIHASGNLELSENTQLDMAFGGNLDLSELKSFMGLDSLKRLAGNLELNMKAKGHFMAGQDNWSQSMELSGSAELSGGEIQSDESGLLFEDLAGKALLIGNDAAIENLSGSCGGNTFVLKGFLRNLLPSLFDNESILLVESTFESPYIDLNHWLGENSSGSPETGSSLIPEKLALNLNLKVGELRYNDFTAKQINGIARMNNGALRVSPVEFNAAGGSVRSDITLRREDAGTYIWTCDADLRKINVRDLFRQFGNFGQSVITDANLRGNASALVTFRAQLDASFTIDAKSVQSLVEITLDEGELIKVDAFGLISDYLRKNKLIAPFADPDAFEKELEHIEFSSMRNQIEVKDGAIRIPSMDIESSAMDISLSGVHYFDNRIDYSFNFRIRDILKKRQSEFGEEEDDELGSRFFLSMKGTTENPEFGFDRSAAKQKRKEDREKERQEFRQLLRDEFGLFRKDPDLQDSGNSIKPPEEVKMTIVWDDDTTSVQQKQPAPAKANEDKKKITWKDRLSGEEEEEAPAMQIEDENF